MPGDHAEAHDDGDPEPAVAHDLREQRVLEIGFFHLLGPRFAPVFEHALSLCPLYYQLRGRGGEREGDAQEVPELADDGTGSDDREANPDAPDDSTQDGDDLVSEELQHLHIPRQLVSGKIPPPNLARAYSPAGMTERT